MKELIFITGNAYKFESAKRSVEPSGLTLIQKQLALPEIQSKEVETVASFSAQLAVQELGVPLVVGDVGYYIEALNGFPGPFIKYINEWLLVEDLLRLMSDKENRRVVIKEALAFGAPGIEPVIFTNERVCALARQAGQTDWAPINQILIPEGFDRVESEIPREAMLAYHEANGNHWKALAKYVTEEYR